MSATDEESFGLDDSDIQGRATIEEIPAEECLLLLGMKSVGRLIVVVADEPDAFPVNYVVDGTDVVFRTAYGLKLMQSVLQRVAFEVDEIDEVRHEGWSIVLRGVAEEMTEDFAGRSSQQRDDVLTAWPKGAKDRWIRVIPRIMTGRRLVYL